MIVEVVCLSVASIFLGSLWFADRILKREHDDDLRDESKLEKKEEAKGPRILPYFRVELGSACPICGEPTTRDHGIKFVPRVCSKGFKCVANGFPHLHGECQSCNGKFLMAPKS